MAHFKRGDKDINTTLPKAGVVSLFAKISFIQKKHELYCPIYALMAIY